MNQDTVIRTLYERFIDRKIEIIVDEKPIHVGILTSASSKDFYIIITVKKPSKSCSERKSGRPGGIVVHFPTPFKIVDGENGNIIFSYKMKDFTENKEVAQFFHKKINQCNLRKYNFFEKEIIIRNKT